MRKTVWALGLILPSLAAPAQAEPGHSAAERALVTALFTVLQPRSFALNVEFCGYVVRDAAGHLRLTGPVAGAAETCQAPWPEHAAEVLASWHTHGGFDMEMWNELPSDRDMRADRMEGVDGWVATPGGRLWHIDGERMVAALLCGPRCLPWDPDYDPAATGVVGSRYSYWDLMERFEAE